VESLSSYDVPVSPASLKKAQQWFFRRAEEKIPVAYLTGRSWFAGLEFLVDSRALIPRSPIAELILSEFSPWLTEPPEHALDLCCGGGCIGIAIASVFAQCKVDMVDLSADAIDLANANIEKHALQDRVVALQGNLFSPLQYRSEQANGYYDIIVTNPPYVDGSDMRSLAAEFSHEPELGLTAGPDGLNIVKQILDEARSFLKDNGILIVEVGNSKTAIEKQFSELDLIWVEFAHGGDGVFIVNAQSL